MTRLLVLLHLGGNAVLLGLGYYWLGLGESRGAALAWSAGVALFIVAGACFLHGSAFAGSLPLGLRHLPWTMLVALAALALYLAIPSGKWWRAGGWTLAPILLVGLFAGAARHGWRIWRGFTWRVAAAPLLVFAGVWIPLRLLAWVPRVSGFWMEMASFAGRAAAAYLLFVAAWLSLARWISAGKPSIAHVRTVSLP